MPLYLYCNYFKFLRLLKIQIYIYISSVKHTHTTLASIDSVTLKIISLHQSIHYYRKHSTVSALFELNILRTLSIYSTPHFTFMHSSFLSSVELILLEQSTNLCVYLQEFVTLQSFLTRRELTTFPQNYDTRFIIISSQLEVISLFQ